MTKSICSVEGCPNPCKAKNLCRAHYQKLRTYGDPLVDNRPKPRKCSVQNCNRTARGRGLCKKHHLTWSRYGDPNHPVRLRRPTDIPFDEWFWQQFRQEGDCLVWVHGTNDFGYGIVSTPWRTLQYRSHQVVWILTNGPIPDGLEVLHQCDNPPCGKIEHLRLDTHAENMADAAQKGRMKKGEQVTVSKLTEAQVIEIRKLRSEGWTLQMLADTYNVSVTGINKITLGKTWKHLLPPSAD